MTPYRRETLFVHRFKLIDTFAGTVWVIHKSELGLNLRYQYE